MRTNSVLLYVAARVKQLVLLWHLAKFKQLVLWLFSVLVNANTIRAVIRESKGSTVSAVMSVGQG
jgi:Tfp pilus assembly pilus retraction ATPase PilT